MKIVGRLAQLFRPSGKALADPGGGFFDWMGLQVSTSGFTVSAEAAIKVPAVAAAVRLIAEAAATLPRRIVQVQANGTETHVADHWAADLLNGAANPWTSGYEAVRDLMIDALTDDRGGLLWANRLESGKVAELIRYRAGVVNVDFSQVTGEPTYKIDNRPEVAANMVHVRAAFGKSPLTLAREAIAIAMVLERHAQGLFANGARPSGALMFPPNMGKDAVTAARAGWAATHEGQDAGGKTAVLYDGVKFEPFTFKSTDAQFIENRKFQITEIARCFRVPPSMLFDMDRATWGNVEQMGKEFLIYCLEPWLCAVEAAFTRCFFGGVEGARLAVRFERDDLTRADLQTRATTINSLIASEVINPNIGAAWLGLPPRPGGEIYGNRNITTDTGGRPPKGENPDATI
jgi:HK97 family phage portal protein